MGTQTEYGRGESRSEPVSAITVKSAIIPKKTADKMMAVRRNPRSRESVCFHNQRCGLRKYNLNIIMSINDIILTIIYIKMSIKHDAVDIVYSRPNRRIGRIGPACDQSDSR